MANRGDIEAGKAHVRLTVKDSEFHSALGKARAGMANVATKLAAIGAGMTAMGAAIVAPLAAAVTQFTAMGSELADVSARTGLAASKLAELKYAAEQSGAALKDVEAALRNMAKKGFDVKDFDSIAASIAAIEDPSERAARAMEVFGKSGTSILPMLADLQALSGDARKLGIVPSESDVAAANRLGDAFDQLKSVAMAAVFKIGAALAPVLEPALGIVIRIAGAFNLWAEQNAGIIRTIAGIGVLLVAVGGSIAAFAGALGLVGAAVGGISALVPVLTAMLPVVVAIGPPLLAVVGGVAALAAAAGGAYLVMRHFNITLGGMVKGFNELPSVVRAAIEGFVNMFVPLRLIVTLAGPLITAAGLATTAIAGMGGAALQAAQHNIDLAASFDDVTDSADKSAEAMARSIAAAEKKRQALRDEFLTPEERGQRKEAEIIAAKDQVIANARVNFISREQAKWEIDQLNIALQRHRAAEAERREREAAAKAARGAGALPKLPEPNQMLRPELPELPGMPELKRFSPQALVGFSGEGLARQLSPHGAGSGPQEKANKTLAEIRAAAREQAELLREIKTRMGRGFQIRE